MKDDLLESKRRQFSGGSGRDAKLPALFSLAALAVIAIAAAGYLIGKEDAWGGSREEVTPGTSGIGKIALADISDGKARFMDFNAGDGTTVRYYVVTDAKGGVHTAFDACDACWPEGKGYEQSGDTMTCRNCGRKFPIARIGEVRGGCNPAPLKSRIEGGKLIIDPDDIRSGAKYFRRKASE